MRHQVQPVGAGIDFDSFSAKERPMPQTMEQVYICVEARVDRGTARSRNHISPSSASDAPAEICLQSALPEVPA